MGLFDLFSNRKTTEALTGAVHENTAKLEQLAQAIRDETRAPALVAALDKTTAELQATATAVQRGLGTGALEAAIAGTAGQVQRLNGFFARASTVPIPVQTFPLVDDVRFETEKRAAATAAGNVFLESGNHFIAALSAAPEPVEHAIDEFFAATERFRQTTAPTDGNMLKEFAQTTYDAARKGLPAAAVATLGPVGVLAVVAAGEALPPLRDRAKLEMSAAIDKLVECSPKRVLAAFQKESLDAGWEFVCAFNRVLGAIAAEYPRCRAGVFGSRLGFADVLQVSDEILASLRATSTVLEDAQRRHDLLERLAGELRSDLDTHEIDKVWAAVWKSFKDALHLGDEHDGLFGKALKNWSAAPAGVLTGAVGILLAPAAQFQGQLAREQRIRVFLATSLLLKQGWAEWSKRNAEVVIPNLERLFAMKTEYACHKLLTIGDTLSANGYDLSHLPQVVGSALAGKADAR